MNPPLLQLDEISKNFLSSRGANRSRRVRALDNVDLVVDERETVGIVGESGCGKTTLARIILGTLPPSGGKVFLEGIDLAEADRATLKDLRREVQMVFQNPYTSIDPRFTIFKCVAEPLRTHTELRDEALESRVGDLLSQVGISTNMLGRYPHELSGGQLQRVAIARALALEPKIVILDEPTSALDVSVQAQILNLLRDLERSRNLTYIFISHDLNVIRHVCDRVVVMYLGRIVEVAPTVEIFSGDRHHPYTDILMESAPNTGNVGRRDRKSVLDGIEQSGSDAGCMFAPRCPIAIERCATEIPALSERGSGHPMACHVINEDS